MSIDNKIKWQDHRFLLYFLGLLEILLLAMILESADFSILLFILILGLFFIFQYPEIGFGLALNTNVLLTFLFDNISVGIPSPVVIAFLILLVGGFIIYLLKKGINTKIKIGAPIQIAFGIGLVMLMGLLHSTDISYGFNKLLFYFLINFNLIALPLIFIKDYAALKNIFKFAYIFGLILGIIALCLAWSSPAFLRFQVSENASPIWLARSMGISFLAGIFLISIAKRDFIKFLILLTFPLFIYVMFRTWSRGPIIGLFGCLFLFYFLQPSESKFRKLFFMVPALAGIFFFLLRSSSHLASRLQSPLTEEWSTAFRLIAWFQGFRDFITSPLTGIGTGSFSMNAYIGVFKYPHNLFLELACENGIVGLLLIISFVFITIRYSLKTIQNFHKQNKHINIQLIITSLTIFIFSIWNSMFSGNITINEVVWLSAGLIYVLYSSSQN
jgi:O-antigen ligase